MKTKGDFQQISFLTQNYEGIDVTLKTTETLKNREEHKWWHRWAVSQREERTEGLNITLIDKCEKCKYVRSVEKELIDPHAVKPMK